MPNLASNNRCPTCLRWVSENNLVHLRDCYWLSVFDKKLAEIKKLLDTQEEVLPARNHEN